MTSTNTCFNPLVLTHSAWPLPSSVGSRFVPPVGVMQTTQDNFTRFYNTKHANRKLTWLHSLSTVEMTYQIQPKPKPAYQITASAFQAGVLMCLYEPRTYAELKETTMLSDEELKYTIETLLKVRLVTVVGGGDDNDTSTTPSTSDTTSTASSTPAFTTCSSFALNAKFRPKQLKVNINITLAKDKTQETDVRVEVERHRIYEIEAAIVRIAKARKTLTHNDLMNETITQLSSRFTPQVAMIKKAIGALIDKEYLARSETSKDTYEYLA